MFLRCFVVAMAVVYYFYCYCEKEVDAVIFKCVFLLRCLPRLCVLVILYFCIVYSSFFSTAIIRENVKFIFKTCLILEILVTSLKFTYSCKFFWIIKYLFCFLLTRLWKYIVTFF